MLERPLRKIVVPQRKHTSSIEQAVATSDEILSILFIYISSEVATRYKNIFAGIILYTKLTQLYTPRSNGKY